MKMARARSFIERAKVQHETPHCVQPIVESPDFTEPQVAHILLRSQTFLSARAFTEEHASGTLNFHVRKPARRARIRGPWTS